MNKCKSASKYKGLRRPRCNDGKGCDYCNQLYTMTITLKQLVKEYKKLTGLQFKIKSPWWLDLA